MRASEHTNMRNRILFISRAYGEHAGGMERLSFELINQFSPPCTAIVHQTPGGKSLLSTRLRSIAFVITVLPAALQASKRADMIHIGDPVLSVVGWCVALVRRIPVAVTIHGVDISYTNPIYKIYLNLFFRSFAAYIPISQYAKNLLDTYNVRGSVTVIPPGIRDHLYDASKTKHDLQNLIQQDISKNVVLATTGRLVKRKGHEWFIRNVFLSLPQNYIYVIAGSGPESTSISRAIKSLRLEGRVFMLGRISHEDQITLLNTIDAFIQPNIEVVGDVEGFGIAPLEAALCNRAVFAANREGIPSAIHDGKNGTLIESGNADAWVKMLSGAMPQINSREYTLKTFGWQHVAAAYKKVFAQIADHS